MYLILIALAFATATASKLRATPVTLKIFDQNFHSNSFCKVTGDLHQIALPDRSMDLESGEIILHDKEFIAEMHRRTLAAKKGREIRFEQGRTKETCVGPKFQWHESITSEGEWQNLVQKELDRVLQVPTEQHLWVATVWSHVTVDHKYTTSLGKKLGLPHHHDQDEEGNLVPFLHSAFGQYISMNDDFGPVNNPGYFMLPLNARMAQLAQDEKLFEHLFPLPAIFKIHPSVRVFVDHAGKDEGVDTCGGEELDIYLTPVANKPNVHATQIASEWNSQLHQTHKDAGLRFFSTSSHMVTLDREDRDLHSPIHLDQVVEWLARDSRVADIELRPRFFTSNGYGASITQIDPEPLPNTGPQGGTPAYGEPTLAYPIYAKNIKGQGQVVGVGDSGLDYDSCFFHDAANKITQAQIPQGQTGQPKNFPGHRKILQYVGYADNMEGEVGGHGSHVAGSVAGKVIGNLGEQSKGAEGYQGAAPEAKVAFFDIGRPGERGLRVPQSLATTYFPPSRQVNAFIHTNSWGSNANAYSGTARDMDLYQYEHQDYLVLVAAGNSGANGQGSVGTPAVAKNIIGVGASVAPKNSWGDKAVNQCTPTTGAGAKCTRFKKLENSMASFSSSGPTFDSRQQPVVSAPGQNIISSRSGRQPGLTTCTLTRMQGTSMATPITAGNAALVRQYFTEGFYPTGAKTAANAQKPTGALIKAAIVNGARVINNADKLGQVLKRGAQPVGTVKGKPDTVQGHGVVTLGHSLMFTDSPNNFRMRVLAGFCPGGTGSQPAPVNGVPRRRLVDAYSCKRKDFLKMVNVANNGQKTYTVPVTANTKIGVNVTLAWSDAPGTLNSRGPALVNNLDLVVKDQTGKEYLPTSPLTGARGIDGRDTVEKVILTTDEMKTITSLTITVKGTAVTQGPVQPFALVVGGAVNPPVPPTTPVPDDPPGNVVIDAIEDTVEGGDRNSNTGGVDSQGNPRAVRFSEKNASTFGIIVFANVAALVLILIVIIILFVVGSWCCFKEPCSLTLSLAVRGLALVATIVSFVFVAVEQSNIEEIVPTAKFGTFWQQNLMLVALGLAVVMIIVGGLIGVLQVTNDHNKAMNFVCLVGDSLASLALGAASIAAANVGKNKYFFLRQSVAALVTMCLFLVLTLIDAAQAFGVEDDESDSGTKKSYVPSSNKTSYNKTETTTSTTTSASRRDAPAPPKERARPRPKSTRGEILVALYDYQGQEADELDFQEGARIELIEDHLDGWATGVELDTRKEGLFPLNYTEKEQ